MSRQMDCPLQQLSWRSPWRGNWQQKIAIKPVLHCYNDLRLRLNRCLLSDSSLVDLRLAFVVGVGGFVCWSLRNGNTCLWAGFANTDLSLMGSFRLLYLASCPLGILHIWTELALRPWSCDFLGTSRHQFWTALVVKQGRIWGRLRVRHGRGRLVNVGCWDCSLQRIAAAVGRFSLRDLRWFLFSHVWVSLGFMSALVALVAPFAVLAYIVIWLF